MFACIIVNLAHENSFYFMILCLKCCTTVFVSIWPTSENVSTGHPPLKSMVADLHMVPADSTSHFQETVWEAFRMGRGFLKVLAQDWSQHQGLQEKIWEAFMA